MYSTRVQNCVHYCVIYKAEKFETMQMSNNTDTVKMDYVPLSNGILYRPKTSHLQHLMREKAFPLSEKLTKQYQSHSIFKLYKMPD